MMPIVLTLYPANYSLSLCLQLVLAGLDLVSVDVGPVERDCGSIPVYSVHLSFFLLERV